mgnify:CR=1 FL=1
MVLVRDRRGMLKLSRHAYTKFYELANATGFSAPEKKKLRERAKGSVAVFLQSPRVDALYEGALAEDAPAAPAPAALARSPRAAPPAPERTPFPRRSPANPVGTKTQNARWLRPCAPRPSPERSRPPRRSPSSSPSWTPPSSGTWTRETTP